MAKKKKDNLETFITIALIVLAIGFIVLMLSLRQLSDDYRNLEADNSILKIRIDEGREKEIQLQSTIRFWVDEYLDKGIPDSVEIKEIELEPYRDIFLSNFNLINRDCENLLGINFENINRYPSEIIIQTDEEGFDIYNRGQDEIKILLACGKEKRDSTIVSQPLYVYKKICPEEYEVKEIINSERYKKEICVKI